MPKGRKKGDRETKRGMTPSSYNTMPHYFPTEQVDIVRKVKTERRLKKKSV
jgi:hypothetical protein